MKKHLMKGLAAAAALPAAAGSAEAAWTVDISSVSTDVTTVGVAILALAALIFGFRIVKRMIGR